MKYCFEAIRNNFCDICSKKKTWLVAIYARNKNKARINTICHECINEMGFELAKAMKPNNFKY